MPLETRAKVTAERLLLMTEALIDAVVNERTEDLQGMIDARRREVAHLSTMDLDAPCLAILRRVQQAEEELLSLMLRTQGSTLTDLANLFSGSKQVKAYKPPSHRRSMQRTG
jgi:hypothetical protein